MRSRRGPATIARIGPTVLTLFLLAVPIAGETQPTGRIHRIGYLATQSAAGGRTLSDAFRQGLRDLGYEEGRNLVVDPRWAGGEYERLPILARELVRSRPDLILSAGGPPAAGALKAATATIPVVFVSGNAVSLGLVANLAQPGGNLTGLDVLAEELDGKRLELLREALPAVGRVAVLWNPGTRDGAQKPRLEAAAQALGLRVRFTGLRHPRELDTAFAALVRDRPDALLVSADPVFLGEAGRITGLAAAARLPAMYFQRAFAEEGGLLSYGADFSAIYRRAATYVDRILKGARPGSLPVEQPTRFELVVNLRTARALGLAISPALLGRADDVIE